ncbi:hypothetical protein Tco_1018748 [Tanacetum coccineum]|uniref:Tf2-1-like SH3-like domain-containing protein n=1 Tax=Tanacetum coccineum TaxID=301880 RepID=A0ABQ5FWL6_9ASTR
MDRVGQPSDLFLNLVFSIRNNNRSTLVTVLGNRGDRFQFGTRHLDKSCVAFACFFNFAPWAYLSVIIFFSVLLAFYGQLRVVVLTWEFHHEVQVGAFASNLHRPSVTRSRGMAIVAIPGCITLLPGLHEVAFVNHCLNLGIGDRCSGMSVYDCPFCKLYKLELPEELSSIHNTFHVSNLKKCLSDESLVIPMKELQLDDKLNFVEEPVEVMDREIKQLKRSRIPIIKVRWNSKRGPEFTWEREDEIRAKYPHLFSIITSSSIKSRDEISVRGGDYNNPQFS